MSHITDNIVLKVPVKRMDINDPILIKLDSVQGGKQILEVKIE